MAFPLRLYPGIFLAVCVAAQTDSFSQSSLQRLGVPEQRVAARGLSASSRAMLQESARGFYEFWTTGDENT